MGLSKRQFEEHQSREQRIQDNAQTLYDAVRVASAGFGVIAEHVNDEAVKQFSQENMDKLVSLRRLIERGST